MATPCDVARSSVTGTCLGVAMSLTVAEPQNNRLKFYGHIIKILDTRKSGHTHRRKRQKHHECSKSNLIWEQKTYKTESLSGKKFPTGK